MPPVLGYYQRHHFYVMQGANNDKEGVDDRCCWKEDGNGREIVGFLVWVRVEASQRGAGRPAVGLSRPGGTERSSPR